MNAKQLEKSLCNEYKLAIAALLKKSSLKGNVRLIKTTVPLLLNPGKMQRAQTLLRSYLRFSKKKLNKNMLAWAVSMELIQAFILIQDDLVDGSWQRRGGDSLHRLLAKKKYNMPHWLAMIIADILLMEGMERFFCLREAPARLNIAFQQLIACGRATATGELEEMTLSAKELNRTSIADIENIYLQKTSRYSFVAPLVCGAIVGGASSADLKKLEKAGCDSGIAFQLYDDLFDLWPKKYRTAKSYYQDIHGSKITWPLTYAYLQANAHDKQLIKSIYGKTQKADKDIQEVLDLFTKYSVEQAVLKRIKELSAKAFVIDGISCYNLLG